MPRKQMSSKKKPKKSQTRKLFITAYRQYGQHFRIWFVLALLLSALGYVFDLGFSEAESSVWNTIMSVVGTLAIIWLVRHVYGGSGDLGIKSAIYRGSAPLIKFLLYVMILLLQLVPFTLGATIYNTAIVQTVAVSPIEYVIFGMIWLALSLPSLYWLSGSIYGIYIVTLPDMEPVQSFRLSFALAKGRRSEIAQVLVALTLSTILTVLVLLYGLSSLIASATTVLALINFIFLLVLLPLIHLVMFGHYEKLREGK